MLPKKHGTRQRPTALVSAVFALGILIPGPVPAQEFDRFPGFDVAARADVISLTGSVLARFDDDRCAFTADTLVEAARRALVRNGIVVTVPTPPPAIPTGVGFDVSALVLPVLDTEACAVATRLQLTIGAAAVALVAEHFNLLTWTATGLLPRMLTAVDRDVSAIADALRRERQTLTKDER